MRVSGDPLHPECFKCVDCGKNLKNQGNEAVLVCIDISLLSDLLIRPASALKLLLFR